MTPLLPTRTNTGGEDSHKSFDGRDVVRRVVWDEWGDFCIPRSAVYLHRERPLCPIAVDGSSFLTPVEARRMALCLLAAAEEAETGAP